MANNIYQGLKLAFVDDAEERTDGNNGLYAHSDVAIKELYRQMKELKEDNAELHRMIDEMRKFILSKNKI